MEQLRFWFQDFSSWLVGWGCDIFKTKILDNYWKLASFSCPPPAIFQISAKWGQVDSATSSPTNAQCQQKRQKETPSCTGSNVFVGFVIQQHRSGVCVCVYWKLVKIPTCGGPRTDRHKWTYGATTSAIRGIITNLGLSGPTKKRAPDWLGYTEDFFLPSCFWGFITYNMISNKPIHTDPY